jgi:hypothetical protein
MKTVIGIVGVKTSGKSTVAQIIKELDNNTSNIKEVALADKLKNVCAEVFNIPRNTFDDQRYKEIPFSIFNIEKTLGWVELQLILNSFDYLLSENREKFEHIVGMKLNSARHIAQIVGTQGLRALGDEDIHCHHVKLGPEVTIISDLRFPNEYKYFSKLEGVKFIPLYINRDLAEAEVDMETSHVSETSVFLFRDNCIKIENNSTLDDLKEEVRKALIEESYGL